MSGKKRSFVDNTQMEKPPKTPKTLKDPKPQPLFQTGSLVEVCSSDPGFEGAWYEAVVLEAPTKHRTRYKVQYKTLLSSAEESSNLLEERVRMSMIRPSVECMRDKNAVFGEFELVDAFHNEGWWPGVVLKKMEMMSNENAGYYTVVFPISRENVVLRADELRKRKEWDVDKQCWVSADQLRSEDQLHMLFCEGAQVEVSRDKENFGVCWFVATIAKIIGKTCFLVEYDNLTVDNIDNSTKSPLQEIVDEQYIRPCPPLSDSINFKVLDEVEVFYKGGWFLGVISVISKSNYMVKFIKDNDEDPMLFDRTVLRSRHIWDDGHWNHILQGEDDKVAAGSTARKLKRKEVAEASPDSGALSTKSLKKPKFQIDMKGKKVKKCVHRSSRHRQRKNENSPSNSVISSSNMQPEIKKDCHALPGKEASITNPKSMEHSMAKNSLLSTCTSAKKLFEPEAQNHESPPLIEKDTVNDHKDTAPCVSSIDTKENNACAKKALSPSKVLSENACLLSETDVITDQNELIAPHTSMLPDEDVTQNSVINSAEEIQSKVIEHVDSCGERENIVLVSNQLVLNRSPSDKNQIDGIKHVDYCSERENIALVSNEFVLTRTPSDKDQSDVIEHADNQRGSENVTPIIDEHNLKRTTTDKDNFKHGEMPLIESSPMELSNKIKLSFTKNTISELIASTNEILKIFPQDPHFQPLLELEKDLREGLAYGLVMSFASLVHDVRNLSLFGCEQDFEEKLKSLDHLEKYGFNIESVRARLNKLIKLRGMAAQSEDKKKSAGAKMEELEEEEARDNLQLLEIEESLNRLNERKECMILKMKNNRSEIDHLKLVARAAEQDSANTKFQFDASLTAPW